MITLKDRNSSAIQGLDKIFESRPIFRYHGRAATQAARKHQQSTSAMLYELIGVVGRSALFITSSPTNTFSRSVPAAASTRSKSTPSTHTTPPPYTPNIPARIARTAGNQVLTAGGVVRGITNWGTFLLPKPARKQGATYHNGHYFIMRFDSSAKTQHAVKRTLGLDPRMIRYSMVKVGTTLDEVKDVGGKVDWGNGSRTD
jgi:small subunit ribosomal protein S6